MGWLPRCVYYIRLQSPMAWNQESLAIWTTLGSTRFGNPSVQNQAEGVDQWHSQEPYSGTHDCRNLCCWISKAWATACTHSHLLYWRLQATHSWGRRPHDHKLPNSETNKLAHETVARCMMHGPCEAVFPNTPRMEKGKCKKNIHTSSNPRRWWM